MTFAVSVGLYVLVSLIVGPWIAYKSIELVEKEEWKWGFWGRILFPFASVFEERSNALLGRLYRVEEFSHKLVVDSGRLQMYVCITMVFWPVRILINLVNLPLVFAGKRVVKLLVGRRGAYHNH